MQYKRIECLNESLIQGTYRTTSEIEISLFLDEIEKCMLFATYVERRCFPPPLPLQVLPRQRHQELPLR